MSDVFFNGRFVGEVEDAAFLASRVREERRKGELPVELSVRHDKVNDAVVLTIESGRVLRPLIVAKEGKSLLKDEHILAIASRKLGWNDLVAKGIVEYIDASEEENALVALDESQLTSEHTHLEIDPVGMLGLVTSLVPYANHDHSSRLNRGSKTQKQALGLYAANFHSLLDTDVSVLYYPQTPLVRSFVYDAANFYPAGQNMVVAILPHGGYNMEDSIVINKASVERGLARNSYFRPYSTTELRYTGNLKDNVCVPSKEVSGYRTENKYRFLEDDGIVYPEAELKEEDVVVGKISPPKFLLDIGEISLAKSKKENSITIRRAESGIIDSVFVALDGEGNKIVQVRTRDDRVPELGDKFSTSHGQKGVIGLIVPEENMPFTSRGITPDIIFNPHGIPGRMTVSYLIEMLAGKVASSEARVVDGTPFDNENPEELEAELLKLGFRPDGKETLYDGVTGKQLEAKIYIGNMYYLKLRYMVANAIQMHAGGKITLLTRQPVEGRAKGGALRLGEMEKDAIVAHGASLLLKERFSSDNVIVYVCSFCGALGMKDKLGRKEVCPLCSSTKLEPVEISYASKLLMEELISMHFLPKFILKNKYE